MDYRVIILGFHMFAERYDQFMSFPLIKSWSQIFLSEIASCRFWLNLLTQHYGGSKSVDPQC